MALALTKTAFEIFNPISPSGAARGPVMDEVRLWGHEMEQFLDGAVFVTGPGSSTDEYLPRFNGTTGRALEESSVASNSTDQIRAERSGGGASIVARRIDTHGDNVVVAAFRARGKSDAGTDREYAQIWGHAVSDADGAENGRFRFRTLQAGVGADRLVIDAGVYSLNATGGDKGVDTLNFASLYQNGVPVWRTVVKATTETVQSNTTLFTDAELKFPMLANTKYTFRLRVIFETGATGDFKFRHTGPASPTLVRITRAHIIGAGSAYAGITTDSAYSASDVAVAGAAGVGWVEFDGIIHNGANAGDFAFRWAQNASQAVDTSVYAGSYIDYIPF